MTNGTLSPPTKAGEEKKDPSYEFWFTLLGLIFSCIALYQSYQSLQTSRSANEIAVNALINSSNPILSFSLVKHGYDNSTGSVFLFPENQEAFISSFKNASDTDVVELQVTNRSTENQICESINATIEILVDNQSDSWQATFGRIMPTEKSDKLDLGLKDRLGRMGKKISDLNYISVSGSFTTPYYKNVQNLIPSIICRARSKQ